MTDREKVIKGLECLADRVSGCQSDCPYYASRVVTCFRVMAADALALLKEQEPVAPDCVDVCTGFDGALKRQYFCGACGHEIMKNDKWQTKYCSNCGQAVKWDG